ALLFSLWVLYLLIPVANQSKSKTKITNEKKGVKNVTMPVQSTKPQQTTCVLKVYLYAPILFFLALLSKEVAIVFLALIPIALWLFANKNVKTIAKQTAPLVIITIGYLALRSYYAGTVGDRVTTDIMDDSYLYATLMQKWATITQVQLRYLGLLIFPYPLSFDYSFNQIPLVNWSNVWVIISVIIHIALLLFAILFIKRQKLLSFGILVYFAGFVLVSNLFFNIGTSMAERFAYMPSLGFCLALAFLIFKVLKLGEMPSNKFSTSYIAIVIVISLIAGAQTIARNADWKNNFSLYTADINKVPNSARAQLYYGIENIGPYQQTGDVTYINNAITAITRATLINPQFHYAWHNLGVAYQTINKWPESVTCYQKVLQLQPGNEQAYYGLGLAYGKGLNQPNKAIPYFSTLVDSLKLTRPDYFEGLGLCYATQGQWQQALQSFKRGISFNPASGKLYYDVAITYANAGYADSSKIYFDQAFMLDPSLKR
ncbi:MAG TPA: tetratricopeptide repeat protein, partial [Bacteroidia bacterium]|nr:tetratricopeptide repeat protein [Bacteroidia bacterium]